MKLKFALFWSLLPLSHGYILDSSCSPNVTVITKAMKGAFSFAQAGYDVFENPSSGPNLHVLWSQQYLIGYMFRSAGSHTPYFDPAKKQRVVSRFASVLQFNLNRGDPERTLNAAIATDKDTYPRLKSDKLIFFCDYSRFTENTSCSGRPAPGIFCDTLMAYEGIMDDIYTLCRDQNPDPDKFMQAWTKHLLGSFQVDRASVIQLCPSYLKFLASATYQTFEDIGTQGALAMTNPRNDWMRAMDRYGDLFDVALLHELTHAISDPTRDIDGQDGYGWDPSEAFSWQGEIDNADNYALFGLAARMISPTTPLATPERPETDGSVTIIPAWPWKRDTPAHGDLHPVNARDLNVALTIDNITVVLKPSDFAGFVVSPPSTSPVTISSGRQYTIGTDVISLANSAIVEDYVTISFPAATATMAASVSGGSGSYKSSSTPPFTFNISALTSARSQVSSSLPPKSNTRSIFNTTSRSGSGILSGSSPSSLVSSLEWISVNWSMSATITSSREANTFSPSISPSLTSLSSISPSSIPPSNSTGNPTLTVVSETSLTLSSHSPGSILSSADTTIYMSSTPISSLRSVNSSLGSSSPSSGFVTSKFSASSAQNNSSSSTPAWKISTSTGLVSGGGSLSSSISTLASSQDVSTGSMSFSGTWTDIESSLTPVSFTFVDIPTQTIVSAAAETTDAVLVGSLFLALQANRKWLTDPKLRSQFLDNVKKTQEETTALLNDLDVKTPDVPDCHNTKRKRQTRISEKQLRDILRNRNIIGSIGNVIKGAVHDIGTLISCASDVVQSLDDAVNKVTPDLGEIEDLTDTLAEIGQDLKDEPGDSKSSATEERTSSTTSTSSLSSDISSSTSTSTSSSSCSIQTASACDTSFSIFTPAGATTASTSTMTLSCSTITACSASMTSFSTAATDSIPVLTISLIGEDRGPLSSLIQLQSMLAAMEADTTGIHVTANFSEETTISTSSSLFNGISSTSTTLATSQISSLPQNVSTSTLPATSKSSKLITPTQTSISTSESMSTSSQVSVTSLSLISTTTPPTGPPASALPCSMYEDPRQGIYLCTCSNGASTPVASKTGANSGPAYKPCPWTIAPAPPITTTAPVVVNTNPYPFTTTMLGGEVRGCETSTTMSVGGYMITLCAGSSTTLSPATTAPPLAYATGTCHMYVKEITQGYPDRLQEDITIYDGAKKTLLTGGFYNHWGAATVISSADTKLPYDVTLTYLEKASSSKQRRTSSKSELLQRGNPEFEGWGVAITAGDTVWTTSDTKDKTGGALPYCTVQEWLLNAVTGYYSHEFDCYWAC